MKTFTTLQKTCWYLFLFVFAIGIITGALYFEESTIIYGTPLSLVFVVIWLGIEGILWWLSMRVRRIEPNHFLSEIRRMREGR